MEFPTDIERIQERIRAIDSVGNGWQERSRIMSQFADGGTFATKPYIGGSNYIKKMSNYGKGDWNATWDGLFWRFIDKHQDFFLSNPRMSMMVHSFTKMSPEKKEEHLTNADDFLKGL